MAQLFLEAGHAFVAWDKLGCGGSSGEYYQQHFSVRASETLAAIEAVSAMPWADDQRLGLSGISQAGSVAPEGRAQRHGSLANMCSCYSRPEH